MTRNTKHKQQQRNSKPSNDNDTLLIEARIIEMFGLDNTDSAHAWNVRLKMQGFGVTDGLTRTKYLCIKCGWRLYRRSEIYFCSNWTTCKTQYSGNEVKKDRGKAHQLRKESLARARALMNNSEREMK